MIFLNFTAELEETWNETTGQAEQTVVIRMNSQEVARFRPSARIFTEYKEDYLNDEMVNWLKKRLT
jgi:hypothetical protein